MGAAQTMAVDEALLERAIEIGDQSPVLRIYRWARPALSYGLNQSLDDEVVERCTSRGVEIVRRITGGGAVYHHEDVTYCVVAPSRRMGVLEAYRWVAGGLISGLSLMGLEAKVSEHPRSQTRPEVAPSACFVRSLRADIEVAGLKVCGSAQVRRRGWFLQHGSIPIADVRPETRLLLRHTEVDHSTCLAELRPGTTWEEAAGNLVAGFTSFWGTVPKVRTLDSYLS